MIALSAFVIVFILLAVYAVGFWRGWTVGRTRAEHDLTILVDKALR